MPRLPKAIIKKYGITKEAWRVFKSKRKTKKGKKSKSTSRKSSMGKRSFFSTSTVFKFLRLGALLLPGVSYALQPMTPKEKMRHILLLYTGVNTDDGRFYWDWLARGWTPYLVSVAITNGVQKLSGILRRL